MGLLNKEEDRFAMWSDIAQEKDRFRIENIRMISKLNNLSRNKKRLVSNREYINYKYNEYGDRARIDELYELWSEEYGVAKAEAETLRVEYEKTTRDVQAIPRACDYIRDDILSLKKAISLVTYEIRQFRNANPDLEKRAKECEEILSRYHTTHRDLEENTRVLADLRDKVQRARAEKREAEERLSERKEELAPLLRTEDSLTRELSEITNRFSKQQELTEEKQLLKEAIGHLEKSVGEWREKVKRHEMKSAEMNEEINLRKAESEKVTSELKEFEALVGPYKELKERLEGAEKELSLTGEQANKLRDEIDNITKENEVLSAKATQFEMVKKKMESIK